MALRVGLVGMVMTLAAAPALAADPAPRWEIGEICATSSLGAQCPRIESQNRSTLLLRWEAVPAEDRKACKQSIENGGKPSYKLMLNCIEERQLKTLEHGSEPSAHTQKDS